MRSGLRLCWARHAPCSILVMLVRLEFSIEMVQLVLGAATAPSRVEMSINVLPARARIARGVGAPDAGCAAAARVAARPSSGLPCPPVGLLPAAYAPQHGCRGVPGAQSTVRRAHVEAQHAGGCTAGTRAQQARTVEADAAILVGVDCAAVATVALDSNAREIGALVVDTKHIEKGEALGARGANVQVVEPDGLAAVDVEEAVVRDEDALEG